MLDGYSATKKIRKNEITKDAIIIKITFYAMGVEKEKALDAGCNNFIEKPFNLQSFIDLLKKYSI